MNQLEAEDFLSMMWATFPNSKKAGENDARITTMIWQRLFADVSFETMCNVFFDKIAIRHKYMPTPAEVMEALNEHLRPEIAEMDAHASFTAISRAVQQTSYSPLFRGGVSIDPEQIMRGKMTELEWEALSSVGGHQRIRMATDEEMQYIRRDYKQAFERLQQRAVSGNWEPRRGGDYITLPEMAQAAIEAERRDPTIDTQQFRDYLQRFGVDR
jgi:Loader and inhibitor of phage G40P